MLTQTMDEASAQHEAVDVLALPTVAPQVGQIPQ